MITAVKKAIAAVKETPNLDALRPMNALDCSEFRKNGHALTRQLLSRQEVSIFRPLIVDAAARYRTEKRKLAERDTYGKAFLQIMNLWRVDEEVRKFTLARRFAKVAADLLGVSNVRLYHDQALFKEPGGGPTPWHQDQFYWPLDTAATITMWMPLVDVSMEMGMLTFASGSHKNGLVLGQKISDESDNQYKKYIREHRYPIVRPAGMQAGDASWHYGNTMHSAPGNVSDQMREIMTVIYMADGVRVTEPKNRWQTDDHQKWLMGLPAGRMVTSELNPLLL
jgi:ectoine hydroxylase-related dioxygenase (phytanoyl-CoA dioxygenase family)